MGEREGGGGGGGRLYEDGARARSARVCTHTPPWGLSVLRPRVSLSKDGDGGCVKCGRRRGQN